MKHEKVVFRATSFGAVAEHQAAWPLLPADCGCHIFLQRRRSSSHVMIALSTAYLRLDHVLET